MKQVHKWKRCLDRVPVEWEGTDHITELGEKN